MYILWRTEEKSKTIPKILENDSNYKQTNAGEAKDECKILEEINNSKWEAISVLLATTGKEVSPREKENKRNGCTDEIVELKWQRI